jgi:hypothetical protein
MIRKHGVASEVIFSEGNVSFPIVRVASRSSSMHEYYCVARPISWHTTARLLETYAVDYAISTGRRVIYLA